MSNIFAVWRWRVWVFFSFSLLSWSFSKTSLRRQPIQSARVHLLTAFSKNDPDVQHVQVTIKLALLLGGWGLLLVSFSLMLLKLSVYSIDGYCGVWLSAVQWFCSIFHSLKHSCSTRPSTTKLSSFPLSFLSKTLTAKGYHSITVIGVFTFLLPSSFCVSFIIWFFPSDSCDCALFFYI